MFRRFDGSNHSAQSQIEENCSAASKSANLVPLLRKTAPKGGLLVRGIFDPYAFVFLMRLERMGV
jgi:hypothetical protein